MMDLLRIYVEKYGVNYTFINSTLEDLNAYNGTDLVINPHSYKLDRYYNYDYGYPFLTSPEHIFSLKPPVKVK